MFESIGVANALAALAMIGTLVMKFQEWPRWKRVLVVAAACGCAGFAVQFYRDNAGRVHSSLIAFYVACVWLFTTAVMCSVLLMLDNLTARQRVAHRRRHGHRAHARVVH